MIDWKDLLPKKSSIVVWIICLIIYLFLGCSTLMGQQDIKPDNKWSGESISLATTLTGLSMIDAKQTFMMDEYRSYHDRIETGVSVSENEIPQLMRHANKIWRIRNKIKNGEWDDLSYIEMTEQIEDYIAQGQKINAIKYYRQEMNDKFSEQVSLREAKEHIDNIHADMKLRGIVTYK